ncbi:MAG: hypothetical protein ACPHV3_04780 [Vibrio sp.]
MKRLIKIPSLVMVSGLLISFSAWSESDRIEETVLASSIDVMQKEGCHVYEAFEQGKQGEAYIQQCEGHPQESMIRYQWQQGYEQYLFPFNQGNNS